MATTKITSPDLFDLGSLNTALQLPSGTTAERPTSPSTGEWRYNTTTNLVEFWDGGEWRDLQSENIPPINSENFNTVLWTGNGTSQSITGVGFKPDWIWIKERTSTSNNVTFDSTRGIFEQLYITTDAESNNTSTVSSFDSDGFSLNGGLAVNENGQDYVAWCWKANGGTTSSNTDGSVTSTVQANTKAGFSIITWAGTGGVNTVGHGLNSAPELILIKGLSSAGDWQVYSSPTGNGNKLALNTSAAQSSTTRWDSTSPTSSVFTLNDSGLGTNLVAYAFQSVAGYSSIGSFVGNGSTNGPIVNTGFEPAFVMTKRSSTTGGWVIWDNKRSTTNPRLKYLQANVNNAEGTLTGGIDFLSNGFQLKDTDPELNGNGDTLIYIAFAADASAAPALADSFGISGYVGNASTKIVNNSGFSPSLVWQKNRSAANSQNWNDAVRGPGNFIFSNNTDAQSALNTFDSFNSNGFTVSGTDQYINGINNAYVAWQWKANSVPTVNTDGTIQSIVSANQAAGFSIVQYTGTGSAGPSIGHGLSSAPTFIIAKTLDTVAKWRVFQSSLGGTKYLNFSDTDAAGTSSNIWNDFTPTATVFQVGSDLSPSSSVIAYCFNDVAGFSKFGTYTGNGSTTGPVVTTGFKPDFVMYKATAQTGNWGILDSVRGETNPIDEWLGANGTFEESFESTRQADFLDTGFQPKGTNTDINTNGENYIYFAFRMNPPALSIPTGEMAFLNVAGGGGGGGKTTSGNTRGGGGGGGGLKTSYGTLSGGGASAESNITLAAGTYTITVGAGGGKSTGSGTGISGGDSSIAGPSLTTITSAGGGGGGDYQVQGAAGGSGGGYGGAGGTGTTTCAGGAGTANQGFNGGGSDTGDSGGGGGAGECGGFGVFRQTYGGVGGSGLMVTITSNGRYYAGGGGGGSDANSLGPRLGGVGGGGYGASGPVGPIGNVSPPGVVNTGGGGGGEGSNGTPGDGGSGIVVIRLNTSDYSGSTTGSPTITTDGDYTVLEYTGSGTYVHS